MYDDNYILPNDKTIGFMRQDNMQWWRTIGKYSEEPKKRMLIYTKFLSNIRNNVPGFKISNYKKKIVGEACGGPYGGIVDQLYPDEEKYQIDIFADDFSQMGWTRQNGSKTHWIASPCEKIDLEDNSLDVLFAFNSIDHGWDVEKSIKECVRVSRECCINFDTNRYKVPGYPDLNHYQVVDYDKVAAFLDKNFLNDSYDFARWHWDTLVPGADGRKHWVRALEFFVRKKK